MAVGSLVSNLVKNDVCNIARDRRTVDYEILGEVEISVQHEVARSLTPVQERLLHELLITPPF